MNTKIIHSKPNTSLAQYPAERIQKALADGDIPADSQLFQSAADHLINEYRNREGLAANTFLALDTGWKQFVDWCIKHDRVSLPASSKTVEEYVKSISKVLRRNTIRVRKWAVSKIHKICGLTNPFDSEFVSQTLSGIYKKKLHKDEITEQAAPFNEIHLDALELLYSDSTLKKQRDLLMMTIAYESLLRSSELCNIRLKHLRLVGKEIHITIPVTKTNHSGNPDVVALSEHATNQVLKYLNDHSMKLGNDGYLFRRLRRNGLAYPSTKKSMSNQSVINVFNSVHNDLGGPEVLHCEPFTSHSCRVGGAQDLLSSGYSILQVQQAGRWSDPSMVYRYGRGIFAAKSAMAHFRRNRQKPIN